MKALVDFRQNAMHLSRCLFLVEGFPITPNASGGGPSLTYSRLELLAHSGCEVALVILSTPRTSKGFSDFVQNQPDVWDTIRDWCTSHRVVHLSGVTRSHAPITNFLREVIDPAHSLYPHLNKDTVATLRQVIGEERPQLIWAQRQFPTTLAKRATMDIPIIYGHYDWTWRIKRYRFGQKARAWRYKYKFWMMKRHDRSMVRQVAGCISPSISEAEEIQMFDAKRVAYFPITYVPADLLEVSTPLPPARIVHLGGMQTTATRIGLQQFLEVVWPAIRENLDALPELWIIGSLKGASESLLVDLKRAGAICTGFVQDLRSVLRPYDIHIVPWEHNTGTRTRIPLALNYSQVLISTRTTAACLSELKDGENCILVDDLHHMGQEVLRLLSDESRRKQIGQSGRKSFLNHFTREAIQPRFNEFINSFGTDYHPTYEI